ncbi:hypothetical protein [Rhodococcus phage RGL3]|uniref:Uncharacterized protein n=1 Tax=Rhodococcus phage RGL3 TaxID=2922221 RepID=G9FHM1_9CAUD|nr:hypothetical protein RoPhRGL3_gp29 [Rhodococcus phage RGL3]AEV52109.1 hypothetical protein [Rhodococcus phage RGL3]
MGIKRELAELHEVTLVGLEEVESLRLVSEGTQGPPRLYRLETQDGVIVAEHMTWSLGYYLKESVKLSSKAHRKVAGQ